MQQQKPQQRQPLWHPSWMTPGETPAPAVNRVLTLFGSAEAWRWEGG